MSAHPPTSTPSSPWTPAPFFYTPRPARVDDVCRCSPAEEHCRDRLFFHPRRVQRPDRDQLLRQSRQAPAPSAAVSTRRPVGISSAHTFQHGRTMEKITLQEQADWSVYESTRITLDDLAFSRAGRHGRPHRDPVPGGSTAGSSKTGLFIGDRSARSSTRSPRPSTTVATQQDHQIFDHLLGQAPRPAWNWSVYARAPARRGRRCGRSTAPGTLAHAAGRLNADHRGDPSMRAQFLARRPPARRASRARPVGGLAAAVPAQRRTNAR